MVSARFSIVHTTHFFGGGRGEGGRAGEPKLSNRGDLTDLNFSGGGGCHFYIKNILIKMYNI